MVMSNTDHLSWLVDKGMYAIEFISSFVAASYAAEVLFIPAPRAAIFDSVWANSSSRLILDAWISASAFDNFSES